MKIRRAIETDIPRILELLVQVNNVHQVRRPDLFLADKTKYNAEQLREILKSDETPVFVAADDAGIVQGYGFCVFQPHIGNNNQPDHVTLYIDDICVDQAARGQHIGRAIYEYIAGFARESGCYNITLNVWEGNDAARAFYESLGMGVQKTGMEMIL
ncbi:MAG: GNAT family N-acetyltransferase [Lachnospiraceae bacterium]|nr:GNAT family N-acetyltransferase [Lachnospiraceae bacterium]